MPIPALISAFDSEHPSIKMENSRLLLGEWTWERAVSRSVSEIEEGPLGSVDLTLRLLRDLTSANNARNARRAPGEPVGGAAHLMEPLWKRLLYQLQPPTDLLLDIGGPVEWPAPLFLYQADAVRTLLTRDAILLADDTGLGKTIEAIAALRILALQRRLHTALLVVPAGVLPQWRRELSSWAPDLRLSTIHGPRAERAWHWQAPAHVYLVSYDTLREDGASNSDISPSHRNSDVVVLDEAQRIKNRDSDIARVCKHLRRNRSWALTATPLENNLDEPASILEFVTPSNSNSESTTRLFAGPEVIERQRVVQLRRRKADVLPQLPPKLTSSIILQLAAEQRAIAQSARACTRCRRAEPTCESRTSWN